MENNNTKKSKKEKKEKKETEHEEIPTNANVHPDEHKGMTEIVSTMKGLSVGSVSFFKNL